jgi:hypothetical protein
MDINLTYAFFDQLKTKSGMMNKKSMEAQLLGEK